MVHRRTSKKAVYQLGRVVFSVKTCDPVFERELKAILPQYDGVETQADQDRIEEISAGCNNNIRALFNHILKRHYKCIWIDACCLVSPNGHRLLMAGGSGSGKSTLAIALALGHDWKVLGEDIVLIDCERLQVIKLAMPFSLKAGTYELLKESIGQAPAPLGSGEWYPLGRMAAASDCDARFNEAIFLDGSANSAQELSVCTITPGEYLRKVLRQSNILRRKGSTETMAQSLASARCLRLSGGTLQQRLNVIRETVSSLGRTQ